MGLILAEVAAAGRAGRAVGLFLGRGHDRHPRPAFPCIGDAVRAFPNLGLSPPVAGLGFGVAIFLGLVAGFVPALCAYRSKITDMLRTV